MVTIVFILAVLGLGLIASLLFTYIKYVTHAAKIEALRFDLEMQDYRLKAMERKVGTTSVVRPGKRGASERLQDRRRDGSVA